MLVWGLEVVATHNLALKLVHLEGFEQVMVTLALDMVVGMGGLF